MSVVTEALVAEYIRKRNQMDGASKRLVYAQSQMALEGKLLAEYRADVNLLAEAITQSGGTIPPEEPET
jgi:hypothetical protein